MLDTTQLQALLDAVQVPGTDTPLSACASAKPLDGNRIAITLRFPIGKGEALQQALAQAAQAQFPDQSIQFEWTQDIIPHVTQQNTSAIAGVKNIIAVASAKGGVGKSTVAANLAVALQQQGARVGLLDADIYGPSQPLMFGVDDKKPEVDEDNLVTPIEAYGVQVMSIGFLVAESQAMIWRGPMVSGALQQLLTQTKWDKLDYLIIDLPPGTGDIQLTMAQKIPVTGAVVVTTPQEIAVRDARKGIDMFEKVSIRVLGIVENMAVHICEGCGREDHLFGFGGGERLARQAGVPFLGALPLNLSVREQGDGGKPMVAAKPESAVGQKFLNIATRTSVQLAMSAKNYGAKFPKIVVE